MTGKGDNPRPFSVTPEQFAANWPMDWDARGREDRRCQGQFALLTSNPPQPTVIGCTCGMCQTRQLP